MFYRRHKASVNIAILGMVVLGLYMIRSLDASGSPSPSQSQCELVVLAASEDPYYPLAEEIAEIEHAPVAHHVTDALACHPVFLLWIASPGYLSDHVMIEFGLAMKEQPAVISSGIITGSTLEQARDLWERRVQVRSQRFFAVNARYPSAHVYEGRIIEFAEGQIGAHPLTKSSFLNALQAADYLTFTGHGGSRYLRLDEGVKITSVDVPSLAPVVVGTASCQTFRPWREDSIALRFVDQGAAAYSGFVFSPIEGYAIGEFDGLPFRYTWQDFAMGHVIQVQNRGTLQGFAQFPYLFLLGDPRTALQAEPPYHLVDDRQVAGERVLTFRDVPAGVIPIRISGGAAYRFVKVPGVTAAAEQDPFFNSRLQMVNIQNDKLILLVHEGGDLTLQMRHQASWHWFLVDTLLDSLDHTFVFSQQSGGDIMSIGFSVLPLSWVGWQMFRKRLGWRRIQLAIAMGIGVTVLQAVYVLVRLDHVTIISKEVVFSPLSMIAAFVLVTCGALVFLQTRSRIGKVVALSVITFASWLPMVFGLVVITAINTLMFLLEKGTPLYSYSLGVLPVGSLLFSSTLSALALKLVRRLDDEMWERSAAG
jgi:uncharacterized membrane protein YgdD (TMEM256/DUF423 family)